jgi:hypothetical protein
VDQANAAAICPQFCYVMACVLKIHEFISGSGELSAIYLRREGDAVMLVGDEGAWPLPAGALAAVMKRYGAPFDAGARSQLHGALELGPGESLRHVRHLAGYDVVARDYLVYEAPGVEATCVMATSVAGALRHLALAAARST